MVAQKRFALCKKNVVCRVCQYVLSVCDVGVLWPNGWMDQDKNWRGGRPRPWSYCVRWGPSSHCPQWAQPPNFRPMSVVPKRLDASRCHLVWYRLVPGDIVLEGGTKLPSPKRGHSSPPLFGPCLLWPNGCMDQDVTWFGGRPWPRPHCVTWGPSSPKKNAQPPIFGPCLLWPNGWMDQDATW